MTSAARTCHIGRLTLEAKELLREAELEQGKRRLAELAREAREDPIAPYRSKRWYPRYVVWELTLACNMRCEHCGSAAGRARPDELGLDEMYRVCDELAALGCERVTLLGGEPLVHPHWDLVAARIRERGYRANAITNGWTLHRADVCDRIAAAGLSVLGISVDGLAPSHDRLRRRPGSFERILRGVELLRERDVPVSVATVVTAESIGDLDGLWAVLRDAGVRVWQIQIGNPLGRLERDDPLLLAPRQLPDLFAFVARKQAEGGPVRIDVADNVGYFGPHEERAIRQKRPGEAYFWTGCHAGIQAMGLDSNGDVKGCQSLPSRAPFVEGNVRERPLADIWNAEGAFRYTRGFRASDLEGECAACEYGPLCKAGCKSAALSYSGSVGDNPMCVSRVARATKP
jgi:radical SAM protein with 4Fe4S-binding SPASM domain